jgi:hypothetical protein
MCPECRRLDRAARYTAFELTLLEAARRLRHSDPTEYDRFNSLIEEAREKQRESQIALWDHARQHSPGNTTVRSLTNIPKMR